MKNTKIKILGMALSASFVLSSVAPTLSSANALNTPATTNYIEIDPNAVSPETITSIIKKAEALKNIINHIPGGQAYAKAIDIIINVLKKVDPAKAAKKVELASEAIETIKFSIEDIQGKTKKAHVEIGLEITKEVLVLADPFASNQKLDKAIENLKNAKELAKNSADITDEDVATIYVKKDLNKAIEEAKKLKRSKETTKEQKEEINQAIKKAVHTKNKAKVTVAEIKAATAELQEFLDNFVIGEEDVSPEENDIAEVNESPNEEEITEEDTETEEEVTEDSEAYDEEEVTENPEDEELIDPEFSNVTLDEIESVENN